MENWLPRRRPATQRSDLPSAGAQRLARLEREVSEARHGFREFQLQSLHEHALALFIDSPGFGQGRMPRPGEWILAAGLRRGPVPLQPAARAPWVWSPGDGEPAPRGVESSLGTILEASIVDFVNPGGFGYIKDRRHVAGFDAHRFSQVPAAAQRWQVQTLELVSLLLHDEPAVYVSDRLPRMERRPNVPTRPLDRFERYGLGTLRQGEDLFIAPEGDGVRMIGAVRSTSQCTVCHECRQGDLLGAFTYALKREAGINAADDE
jgi:hypothetical protein